MFFPDSPTITDNPFEGVTNLQREALEMRFGEGPRLATLRTIGLRMGGRKRAAVCRLIARGIARIKANGYDVSRLLGRRLAA